MNSNELTRMYEVNIKDLELDIDVSQFQFQTTDEIQPLDEIIGQPRALKALELGLGIENSGFNIYVSGVSGMGKKTIVQHLLEKRVKGKNIPPDWIYVNNFDQPDKPIAISLPAGKGRELKKDMENLITRLKDELPKAFRQEDFSHEKQRISEQYRTKGRKILQELQTSADENGLIIEQSPDGRIYLIPKKDDHPMSSEEFNSLSEEDKDAISKRQAKLSEHANRVLAQQRDIEQSLRFDVKEVEKNFSRRIFEPMIREIAEKYDNQKLRKWLDNLQDHMLNNLNYFQEKDDAQQRSLTDLLSGQTEKSSISYEYEINVIVDNSYSDGAPLIIENSPNYKNLFGTIPGVTDRFGRMTTNFTHIKAGSLLQSNGGYLVFDFVEAFLEPLVWKELKRTIKSGFLEYHMYDPFGVFTTSALRPEPIPLSIKLIVLGNPLVYHLLQLYDEDFPEIFKVKADFTPEMDRKNGTEHLFAQFIRKISEEKNILPFSQDGVTELYKTSIRIAEDRSKLTTEFKKIEDIAREASFWAQQSNHDTVTCSDVRRAIDERIYRTNYIEEKIREMISKGSILISIDGTTIGQVNGLGVIQLGDYMFGKPSRLTASVGIGNAGIINIERESRLSGQTYDKAMLILEGYLRNMYAKKHPLSLSASITMEQSYGMVDGDSASVAEVLCLLSSLANIALRQDIAVTGSINQWGDVQAVGGIIAKIEGFFDICKHIGLTGNQGVCIPDANKRNLILRHDVTEAIEKHMFHIWSVSHVDQAIELLSGIHAGSIEQAETFHGRIESNLQWMNSLLKEQKVTPVEHESYPFNLVHSGTRDPRPPLPGERDAPLRK